AYRAARSRAEAYAGAAGLEIDRVLTIQDAGEFGTPIPYARTMNASSEMMAQSAAPAAPPPPPSAPFSPGVTTQEVRVRVDFALKEK
ncbi:MAG: SIMPL domain-containing protein, partial [Pseudomonadota bacterium]|nr:SIMPL domain-containing protein [Pseudomonadota bacterium]